MYFRTVLISFIFLLVASAIKICREHERVLVFRLGKLILPPKGPGVFVTIPIVDKMIKINLGSEKDLEEAERLLWEAKMQKDANQLEIERVLSELGEIRKNLSARDKSEQGGN